MAKVSVIVPIYGVEKYIERCAKSLFEQTLDDIEYIFVNDCTKDNSINILNNLIMSYPDKNVKILHHSENKGLPTARQTGLKEATGEYIAHCDSDDWVSLDIYSQLYNIAKTGNYDIVYCDYYSSDGHKEEVVNLSVQPRILQGPVWNKIVRRTLYQNDIEYPVENKAEDGALMTQLSFYASSIYHLAKPLYYYFQNTDSICRQASIDASLRRLHQECINTDLRIRFLKKNNVLDKYKDDVIIWKYCARHNIQHLLNEKKYFKLWKNTYPEINKEYFGCKYVSLKGKLKFLLMLLRIIK